MICGYNKDQAIKNKIEYDVKTARYGQRWTSDDEALLCREFQKDTPYWEIAKGLQRTCSATLGRLTKLRLLFFDNRSFCWHIGTSVYTEWSVVRFHDGILKSSRKNRACTLTIITNKRN